MVLDPELTLSLPPRLTAWTGLDAFVHALEACTNRKAFTANSLTCHKALALIAGALETAVRQPGNLAARGDMLLGSALAGIAIDNCGTAVAHNISHALAGLAPVHHGLATALGLEATLAWSIAADAGPFAAAARACGLDSAEALPAWYGDLMTRCGVERRLPEAFKAFDAAALAAEMRAPENAPMRAATARDVTESDIERFAGTIMALAYRAAQPAETVRSSAAIEPSPALSSTGSRTSPGRPRCRCRSRARSARGCPSSPPYRSAAASCGRTARPGRGRRGW